MEERSLDEIEKDIRERMERQEQTYAKAKAEAEVKELSSLSQNSSAVIQVQLNNKLADRIKTSADINNKVDETANKLIEKGLQIQEKQINKDLTIPITEEIYHKIFWVMDCIIGNYNRRHILKFSLMLLAPSL